MRFGAGIVEAAGDGDGDIVRRPRIDAAEVALLEIDALADRVDAHARHRAVERESFVIALAGTRQDDRIDHRIVTRHAEQPNPVLSRRRFQRSAHGELVAVSLHLERGDQDMPRARPS